MNAKRKPTPAEAADEVATRWLCERDEGFAPGRAEAFAAWRDRDPEHAAAVARAEGMLALLRELPASRSELRIPEGRRPAHGRLFFLGWRSGIAAALVLGAFVGWQTLSPRAAETRYTTDASTRRCVALGDGTVVEVNVGTDLRVEITSGERRVTLNAGEAHFRVAHDPARPFTVSAAGVSVRAVGTAFNVLLASDRVEVLVVGGRVILGGDRLRPAAGREPEESPAQLGPGDHARVTRRERSLEVAKIEQSAMRALLAWQEQTTLFSAVPLRDVLAGFNRHNTVRLVLEDPAMGDRLIGGAIAFNQMEAFVRLLEQDGELAADRPVPGEIVLRRRR